MWLRCSLLLLTILYFVLGGDAQGSTDNEGSTSRQDGLPTCVQTCLDRILPVYNCSTTSSCFCQGGDVVALNELCVSRDCSYAEQLEAKAFHADTCNYPIRSRSQALKQLSWGMFGLATFFFLGRIASRIICFGGAGFYWDDYAAASCYVPLVGVAVVVELALRDGLGQDDYRLSVYQINDFIKKFYAAELLYNYIIIFTKISLVLLYTRIWWTSESSRSFRLICWSLITLLILTVTAVGIAEVFQCTPISWTWNVVLVPASSPADNDPSAAETGHCLSRQSLFYAFGALNICYDVLILFLPLPFLLHLTIPLPRKIGLCIVFLVGFAVTVCSIGRLNYLAMMQDTDMNVTWNYSDLTTWTLVEVNLSMVCCCMPGIAGLVQRVWRRRARGNCMADAGAGSMARMGSLSSESAVDITGAEMLESRARGSPARRGVEGVDFEAGRRRTIEVPNAGVDDLPCSPVLQVALGETLVCIQHTIPREATKDKFVYKDGNSILHEVEVTDNPLLPIRSLDSIDSDDIDLEKGKQPQSSDLSN